jgi:ABC-type multidrug transport system fused ATPase/permease subunit
MTKFSFEETMQLTKEDYLEIHSIFSNNSKIVRNIILLIFGILFLFSTYTIIIGILLILITVFITFMDRNFPRILKNNYEKQRYYHQPIKYGVSQDEIWAEFDKFRFTSSWENLAVWKLTDTWLRLSANGLPPVMFKKESLKKAGILEKVIMKAKQYAVEYNSQEAKKAF